MPAMKAKPKGVKVLQILGSPGSPPPAPHTFAETAGEIIFVDHESTSSSGDEKMIDNPASSSSAPQPPQKGGTFSSEASVWATLPPRVRTHVH